MRLRLGVSLIVLAVAAGGPVRAQGWGQQPNGNGGMQGGGWGQPQQPQQPVQQTGGAPNVTGAWSWQSPGQNGMDRNTLLFQPDGNFVRVSQLGNGTMLRSWGQYRLNQVGPSQAALQSQTQGWLPREICAQAPGFPMNCQPAPRPVDMSFTMNFTSPSSMEAEGVTLFRDNAPYLLQQPVPERAVSAVPPPYSPQPRGPVYSGGGVTPGIGGRCDDLQQRRICSINDGRLVSSNGCLVCVAP